MARQRGRETVADMLRSLALVGLVVAGIFLVVVWQRPEGAGPDVRSPVDVAGVVAAVRLTDPFPVLAPQRLADGWTATSAWFEPNDPDVEAPFLHLGYTTPAGSYAEVRQTDGDRTRAVSSWVGDQTTSTGTVTLAGLDWRQVESAATGAKALVADRDTRGGPVVVVVTGKADWPELETLAASLR